jgi:hypothetical protein
MQAVCPSGCTTYGSTRVKFCQYCGKDLLLKIQISRTEKPHGDDNDIWLPRQDELQEMTIPYLINDHSCLGYEWKDRPHIAYYWSFKYWFEKRAKEEHIYTLNSTEQLRLSFFMWIAYDKTWNGSDWEVGA